MSGLATEIVKRSDTAKGFEVLRPKRWLVERMVAWLGINRRLAKDYERVSTTSFVFIQTARIELMTRRQPLAAFLNRL